MLAGPKLQLLQELAKGASRDELMWISGYIAALSAQPIAEEKPVTEFVQDASFVMPACTVVYGTETGNSKKVAVDFGNRLKKQGIQAKIKSLDQYRLNDLAKESHMIVVISTQGDGEPPAAAKKFYDHIHQQDISLSQLKYGVLALGDSAYPLFCKAGEDVDKRLHALGGRRIVSMKKCDTDFEADADTWIDELITAALAVGTGAATNGAVKAKPAKSGKKLYDANVVATVNLNDRGSNKETYHIEIATDEPIVYQPGDALGIVPKNSAAGVKKILELLSLKGNEEFIFREHAYKAEEMFAGKINIQYLPERIIQQYANIAGKEIPNIRMDLADLLRIYPSDKKLNIQQLVAILEPIAPRLYSIASSPAAHGGNEVHITVSRDNFCIDGQTRFGLCSDYLAQLKENEPLQVYIQKNNAFRLPDATTDVIMVGPGTGIAPFRSFLFERDAKGDSGRNWLFFGDQHFVTDFLYQTDLQGLRDTGVLTRLNLAFSRDQQEKIYVQHKMQQNAKELFEWLEGGAQLYICGCKDPMSYDVEKTLLNIIAQEKNVSADAAEEYLAAMKEAGRYHKDVY
ncbi:flavodoxin domain-containing protein [Panacibacter sp. DH6]|uniref:assimilatory sulfite reductase (NADPH) n=1 Tax=Panacibacter microcysteis TaxID=2793269 RepID=A0A931MCE1_9BACT|nr:flavodoxin domain-containing protein [Panacibacter microcysteis]MBG9378051.1 flavodoxin domain-containing protein [Panacibacter microcysteis]